MPTPKNVLLIVVDQWRGLMLPKLGADYLRAPQHRPAVRRGRDLPQSFHAMRALRAGSHQPADGALSDEPSRGCRTRPLDARHTNLAPELRAAATTRRSSATPTPRPIRAANRRTIRLLCWRPRMEGLLPAFRATPTPIWPGGRQGSPPPRQGRRLLAARGDLGPGEQGADAAARSSPPIPERAVRHRLVHRRRPQLPARPRRKPWFLHLGYYRPHPPFIAPAPYNAMYRPGTCQAVRAATPEAEGEQHPLRLLRRTAPAGEFFQDGQGSTSYVTDAEIAQMRATYCGLMSEIDDQHRPHLRLSEGHRPVGRHADRRHLRPWREAG